MSSNTHVVASWFVLLGIFGYFVHSLREKTTKEHWWGTGKFTVKSDVLTADGRYSNPQNYQQSVLPVGSAPAGFQSSGIFQVPGNAQSRVPPRIIPQGLSSQVSYNLPTLSKMACDPSDPLSLAGAVARTDKPRMHEPFDYSDKGMSSVSYNAQQQSEALTDSSGALSTSSLPVPTMVGNYQDAGDIQTVNYDRFIVANLDRNRGQGDWIRGDVAIAPVLPSLDTNSLIMFRPSKGTETLNTGAMAVLGGAFNELNRDTCSLAMQSSGGALNTMSGIAWSRPENTSVGAQIAVNAQNMASSKSTGTIGLGDIQVSTY